MTTQDTPTIDPAGAGRRRYWLVWVDDIPILPERPLDVHDAAKEFLREVDDDPTALVEIKQCTREDLDWAGVDDGIGADDLDDEAGGNT